MSPGSSSSQAQPTARSRSVSPELVVASSSSSSSTTQRSEEAGTRRRRSPSPADHRSPQSQPSRQQQQSRRRRTSRGSRSGRSSRATERSVSAAGSTGQSPGVVYDVACCDGPVRFHRVLNENYAPAAAQVIFFIICLRSC